MAPLPFVDAHTRAIAGSPDQVWHALLRTVHRSLGRALPSPVAGVYRFTPATGRGAWDRSVAPGDAVPGFAVTEVEPLRRLTLRGAHRFSAYELRFALTPVADGCVEIEARTSAAFPGLRGSVYRALVIGSGGHRIAMGLLLRSVARRSGRTARLS